MNERLLRDKVEADLLWGGALGEPSGRSVEFWLAFIRRPDPVSWYRAHNASIVAAYLEHEPLTYAELRVERFMMNVALLRVLFSYALVAKPRLALGRLGFFGPLVADPRRRSVQLFLDLRRSFPNAYPLAGPLEKAIADEAAMARALDYGVIAPRLPELYDFSAVSLEEPRLPDLLMQGTPAYAWSPEDRMIWYSGITGGHLRAIALATGAATGFDRLVNRRSPIK